jgi:hypothetical protein
MNTLITKIYFLFLILALSFSSCSTAHVQESATPLTSNPSSSANVLLVKENQKHKIKCIFYGKELTLAGQKKVTAIESIALQDLVSGKEVKYVPIDQSSIVDSLSYFTDVWSPDGEFLVLPRGRFEGFCIIKTTNAIESISNQTCTDHIRVQAQDGPYLWHEFSGWDGADTIEFKAGLSDTSYKFKYNLPVQKISSNDKGNFQAENTTGLIKVN